MPRHKINVNSINLLHDRNELKKNRLFKVKQVFIEWSQRVDINCYNKIFEYENFLVQLFWTFVFTASTGLTFWLISSSIFDFLKFDVVTKTTSVYEIPTRFPTVTFCDNDPFTTSDGSKFLRDVAENNELDINQWHIMQTITDLARLQAMNPTFDNENKSSLGFSFEQIFQCTYNIDEDCKSDLHWYFSFEYGNCFQFNSGLNLSNHKIELKNIEKQGIGLQVTLGPIVNKNQYVSSWNNGMVVFVHNSSFGLSSSEGVYVELGKSTYISVERTFTQKYPFPYSDCVDFSSFKSTLYDFMIEANRTYRQQDCFDLCIQQKIIDYCKCYFTGYDNLNTTIRPCLNLTEYYCLITQYLSFEVKECQQNNCPLECASIKYDLSLSTLLYPNLKGYNSLSDTDKYYIAQYIDQNLTYELFKEMYLQFSVYYPKLSYIELTEYPKTSIIDLLTQIGGSLSMFVRLSIFTAF